MYNNKSFADKANKIHNNKYDYSLIDYKDSKTKIKIICHNHGIFEQTPSKHLNGRGCPICGGSNKKDSNIFINEAKKIHGNKYDYSLVNYKDSKTPVKIICPIHGTFEQIAYNHIKGHGCIKCMGDKSKLKKEDFIKKSNEIHENKYIYDEVNYIRSDVKVKIYCKNHGYFLQKPSNHMLGQGCPFCKNEKMKLSIIDFIQRSNIIHNYYYNYDQVVYINNYTKVKINCPKHGIFEQIPNFHLLGQGCPSCKKSIMENKICEILEKLNIKYHRQKIFNNCKNISYLPFDFYLPDYNICIEYNGKQHYEAIKWFGGENTLFYIQNNDRIKKKFCLEQNIKLIEISYEDDYKINEILNGILL